MCITSFKERVKNVAISCASTYRDILCNYEYVVISEAFSKKYHFIKVEEDNYMHLLGVSSSLSPMEFFNRCIDGILTENDFGFSKKGMSEKSVRGSVREKISVLSDFCNMFSSEGIKCQENFKKGRVSCSFASASDSCTIGFVNAGRPMTLMKNNQLNPEQSKPVLAVLRKNKSDKEFTDVVSGNVDIYKELINEINRDQMEQYLKIRDAILKGKSQADDGKTLDGKEAIESLEEKCAK